MAQGWGGLGAVDTPQGSPRVCHRRGLRSWLGRTPGYLHCKHSYVVNATGGICTVLGSITRYGITGSFCLHFSQIHISLTTMRFILLTYHTPFIGRKTLFFDTSDFTVRTLLFIADASNNSTLCVIKTLIVCTLDTVTETC